MNQEKLQKLLAKYRDQLEVEKVLISVRIKEEESLKQRLKELEIELNIMNKKKYKIEDQIALIEKELYKSSNEVERDRMEIAKLEYATRCIQKLSNRGIEILETITADEAISDAHKLHFLDILKYYRDMHTTTPMNMCPNTIGELDEHVYSEAAISNTLHFSKPDSEGYFWVMPMQTYQKILTFSGIFSIDHTNIPGLCHLKNPKYVLWE